MSAGGRRILERMLDRLFAAIVTGPSIDCRPRNSRQRLDLTELAALRDADPAAVIAGLLGAAARARVVARVPAPPRPAPGVIEPETDESSQAREDRRAFERQQSVVRKLRLMAEEARTYEEDTGVYVLHVGFPLLHIARGAIAGTRRVLAPLAFIPVTMRVSTGAAPTVELACHYAGEDRVAPNEALLAWLERQTGRRAEELLTDDDGSDPWRELRDVAGAVARLLEMEPPAWLGADVGAPAPALAEAPSSDDRNPHPRIIPGAVLGLYPVSNQGLVRDTGAMIEEGAGDGPVRPFLTLSPDLPPPPEEGPARPPEPAPARQRRFEEERFVQAADPCQARAVRLAREQRGLVIHGPPGTGKSQTITNIIADHLVRGERVLFVCDKRTALDVVANRLQHLGLGDLCALIHDPQRDQRDLYMSIRDQLERLVDTRAPRGDERRIMAIDAELSTLHTELLAAWRALMTDPERAGDAGTPGTREAGGEGSFHHLVGRWLAIEPPPEFLLDAATLGGLHQRDLARYEMDTRDALDRAARVDYPVNPWVEAAGVTLGAFLAEPGDRVRQRLELCVRTAEAADETRADGMPPFEPGVDPQQQAAALARLADVLDRALAAPADVRTRWADATGADLERARGVVESARGAAETVRRARPDPQVDAVLRSSAPTPATLAPEIGALHRYLAVSGRWWSFLAFGSKRRAAAVCAAYGLPLDDPAAARLVASLEAERDRQLLAAAIATLEPGSAAHPNPGALAERFAAHDAVVHVLAQAAASPQATALLDPLRAALGASGGEGAALAAAMRAAPARAAALARHAEALRASGLFRADWIEAQRARACGHEAQAPLLRTLQDRLESLETILRIGAILERLPSPLAGACSRLLSSGATPEEGWSAFTKAALAAEVGGRVATSTVLKQLDGARIEASLERIAALQEQKMRFVRDLVLTRWITAQRDRLLAGTGTRLNSQGADVKRRLLTRGRRALRLRQVLAHGRSIDGGDPLFDLRPVWMASPETVAQVFPREPVFDAVIFDEASQCRLEEALPVLTRARRVVIAGDPKQLPPSRFFESSVETSEEPEIETDQDLFEAQQSEVEDLLGAALGLDLEQSYLDVHYRSHNADLIGFSNEHFYGSRLQPIPGHPKNRSRLAPLTLHRVDGTYDRSVNRREAQEVVRIVRDLLRRAEPPSIGVACFNVLQRDAILEALDEAAEGDEAFARRLGTARERRGAASFEGLFVKNLENVQGDERDHIIISTTYGPNPEGRFYRRFGPLLRAGGGRRLNVLVTRARHEVHLVTSIPPDAYRSLPPVPDGQAAGGAWLLFAYLRYAEELSDIYEGSHAARESAHGTREPGVIEHQTGAPSALAPALARRLARRGIGSEVHWGNDGFCVDAALSHPTRVDDVTLGVLSDLTRFPGAGDPVEWEVFRWLVLRSQGWELHRVWSPGVFRDIAGVERQIEERARAWLAAEEDPDGLRVRKAHDA